MGGSHDDTVFAVLLGSHLVGLEILDLFHVDGSPKRNKKRKGRRGERKKENRLKTQEYNG